MDDLFKLATPIEAGQRDNVFIDQIQGSGDISELPRFLENSLRKIIHRLRQANLWTDDYDIQLFIPKRYFVEFAYIWTKYVSGHYLPEPELNARKLFDDDAAIQIDGITIQLKEAFGDAYNLGVFRVGENELILWDDKMSRMLFRAPWATAKYEANP